LIPARQHSCIHNLDRTDAVIWTDWTIAWATDSLDFTVSPKTTTKCGACFSRVWHLLLTLETGMQDEDRAYQDDGSYWRSTVSSSRSALLIIAICSASIYLGFWFILLRAST
jgi:hypothetical protein